MNTRIEALYLEAEFEVRHGHFHTAFQKYLEILEEAPAFAPANYSVGWLYKTQFEDTEKAEAHLRAAMTSNPQYPHPYFLLAGIWLELERLDDLTALLEHCQGIRTIDKSWILHQYGAVSECRNQWEEALKWYQQAVWQSRNNEKIKEYQADLDRCRRKMESGKGQRNLLGFRKKQ